MARISLTEAYDDRSVIAKLEKMSDQVDANTETCEQAVSQAQASAESAEQSKVASETAKAGALDAQTKANEASAKANEASASVTDKVNKTGTATPQVITGTGGLQVQGDLSVGGDLTVSETGSVHFDGSDMEVGGMAIEKDSSATVLSNESGGIRFKGSVTVPTVATGIKTQDAVNGQRLQADLDAYAPMVRTSGNQTISGRKDFINRIARIASVPALTNPSAYYSDHLAGFVTVGSDGGNIVATGIEKGTTGSTRYITSIYTYNADGQSVTAEIHYIIDLDAKQLVQQPAIVIDGTRTFGTKNVMISW